MAIDAGGGSGVVKNKQQFKIRESAPTQFNKLYNNAGAGGLSWCVVGYPTDPVSNTLANCVGYACARFNEIYNEITGFDGIKYPELCVDAYNFVNVAHDIGLSVGDVPSAGAIMCWGQDYSGNGHVAVVERVMMMVLFTHPNLVTEVRYFTQTLDIKVMEIGAKRENFLGLYTTQRFHTAQQIQQVIHHQVKDYKNYEVI